MTMKEKILSYINREKELYEGEKLCLSKCVNEINARIDIFTYATENEEMIETACDVVLGSFILLYEVLKETGENRDIEQALSVKINKEKTVGELEELIRKCSSLEPHQLAREIVSKMYITNHV